MLGPERKLGYAMIAGLVFRVFQFYLWGGGGGGGGGDSLNRVSFLFLLALCSLFDP